MGTSYFWTEQISLLGGFELVQSHDAFDPFEPWPDLPTYSDVIVDRTRITAGVDWRCFTNGNAYLRYIYEDFEDRSVIYNSGTAHMFLTGLSRIF